MHITEIRILLFFSWDIFDLSETQLPFSKLKSSFERNLASTSYYFFSFMFKFGSGFGEIMRIRQADHCTKYSSSVYGVLTIVTRATAYSQL